MADAGFTVYNDSGVFQVDNLYRNLCLRSKGSITTTTGISGFDVSFGEIALASGYTSPILFVGGAVQALPEAFYSGSQIGWTISAGGAVGTTIPYWIFDVPQTPASSGAGMRVYNAAGQLIFDTDQPTMRVVSFRQNDAVGAGTIFTGSSAKTYAVAHCIRGRRIVTVESLNIRVNFSTVNSGVVALQSVITGTIPASPTQTNFSGTTSIIADVTGL